MPWGNPGWTPAFPYACTYNIHDRTKMDVVVLHCSFGLSTSTAFTSASTAPMLRASGSSCHFAGVQGVPADVRLVAVQALPEPRPNDAMLPVELNRISHMSTLPRCLPGDVELVLFDMAGTTVDDMVDGVPLVVAAFRAAFKACFDVDVSFEQANAVRGYEKREALRQLLSITKGVALDSVDAAEVEELFKHFKMELDKLTGSMNTEISGTTAIFEELRGRCVKVCVGSGFPDSTVKQIVDNMGWNVDAYFSSEALGAGRPDPVMVTTAMARFGVTDPRRVVKVGDTAVDVEEGRNAGVFTVSVLTGTQSREKLEKESPDCIIPSVADLSTCFDWPSPNLE